MDGGAVTRPPHCGQTWLLKGETTAPPQHTCWRLPGHAGPHWCCGDDDEHDEYPGGDPGGLGHLNPDEPR